MNDKKVILAIVAFTLLILIGSVFLLTKMSSSKAQLEKTAGAKLVTTEENFNFGDIAYSGGIVTHNFPIKNNGERDLQIANLVTSCMCTQVYFQNGQEKSPKFGMQGMSAPSSWTGILKPGQEGQIVALFDPAYHGPQGVGLIDRIVSFETNDPDHPYLELSFKGNVKK